MGTCESCNGHKNYDSLISKKETINSNELDLKDQKYYRPFSKTFQIDADLTQDNISLLFQKQNLFFSYLIKFKKYEELLTNFIQVAPYLIQLCKNYKDLFPEPIKLLRRNRNTELKLSREQIACLIALSFFGYLNTEEIKYYFNKYSTFDLNQLTDFAGVTFQKGLCILNYLFIIGFIIYERDTNEEKKDIYKKFLEEKVVFSRKTIPYDSQIYEAEIQQYLKKEEKHHSKNKSSKKQIPNEGIKLCDVKFDKQSLSQSSRGIDRSRQSQNSMLNSFVSTESSFQVDFSNSSLAGMSNGLSEDDILFYLKPECLVSLLFTDNMGDNDAICITDAMQYCYFTGSGKSFEFLYNEPESIIDLIVPEEKRAYYGKYIIVMDSTPDGSLNISLKDEFIRRDIHKAYVAFNFVKNVEMEKRIISTGTWRASPIGLNTTQIKFLEQWIAASLSGVKCINYTFGNEKVKNLLELYNNIKGKVKTAQKLYKILFGINDLERDKAIEVIYRNIKEDEHCSSQEALNNSV